MPHNSKPRRVIFSSRRAIEALQQMVEHNHKLLHQILEGQKKIMTVAEDLTREVQETKDAVGAVAVKMQELLDIIAANPNNTPAMTDAIAALNDIQTQLAAMAAPTPPSV